jgi:hypothetical protein
MPYRVFWSPDAELRYKTLLAVSSEAAVLVEAARHIDEQLHSNPNDLGESRHENIRIGFLEPLALEFEVLEDVKTVIVFNVWINKRRPR